MSAKNISVETQSQPLNTSTTKDYGAQFHTENICISEHVPKYEPESIRENIPDIQKVYPDSSAVYMGYPAALFQADTPTGFTLKGTSAIQDDTDGVHSDTSFDEKNSATSSLSGSQEDLSDAETAVRNPHAYQPASRQIYTVAGNSTLTDGFGSYGTMSQTTPDEKYCQACCLQKLPENPTFSEYLCYFFACPPHRKLASVLALALCVALFWGTLCALLGPPALPGGHFFALFVLVTVCYIFGQLISVIHLPPLLGMLIAGFLLRNVPYINVAKDIDPHWASDLRSIALVIILLRAGLGLNPAVLKRLSFMCLRLCCTPCLVETTTVAVASHYILGFPWLWGFLLGFVVGAVSPAVVVPSMLNLQEKRLGVDKGIPTLVIAAASLDDVIAITGFGVCLSVIFSEGNLAWTIAKGPIEALTGILYGCLLGLIGWFIPSPDDDNVIAYRISILLFGALFAMFGSSAIELGGSGALACLTLPFMVAIKWRKHGWTNDNNSVSGILSTLWQIFQPILFGLIGAEVQLKSLEANTIVLGLATLGIGVALRMIASFLVVFGGGLSLKEKIFISLAWLPKATVQAAIGPVALDYARKVKAGAEVEELGIQILTIAVLSILVTAPLGTLLISLSSSRLLNKDEKEGISETQAIRNTNSI